MIQLCDKTAKQLFSLKINEDLMKFVKEKQTINGIKYNVFFYCEKIEKIFGKKFEISKKYANNSKQGIHLILKIKIHFLLIAEKFISCNLKLSLLFEQ